MLYTAFMSGIAVFTAIFTVDRPWQHWWISKWGAGVLRIFRARVTVRGLEHMAPGANYILAANHQSLLDITLIMSAIPQVRFLAKQELLKVPFIGWSLQRHSHPTVSRGSIRSSIESTKRAAALIREKRISVVVFAEGTRSDDGRLQPFKEGAAFLAIEAQTPVLPVAVVNTGRILPARSSHARPGKVELRIGAPVAVAGLTLKDRAALTARLEQEVRALLESRF
jgi:1-acyl-sn-glycerol-3-phosphate acyltransferase